MTTTQCDLKVHITRIIPASRSRVFEAWLDPKALATFIRPTSAMTVPKAEADAREGGCFLIVMKVGGQEIPHHGEYRTIERYERLAFTWHSPVTAPESLVTIDFEEHAADQTKLTLRHIGFPNEKVARDHHEGWSSIAAELDGFLAAG